MEQVIDRKNYRRNTSENNLNDEEKVEWIQQKIRKILYQSLGAAIVLLGISILKFCHQTEILEMFKEKLNTNITISEIQKSGQILWKKATNSYTKLDSLVEKILTANTFNNGEKNVNMLYFSGEKTNLDSVEKNGDENNISKDSSEIYDMDETNTLESINQDESKYETAVEGMNQMLEDANYINENYETTIPVVGTVTSVFGVRNSDNPSVSNYHSGLDIAANTGTQILAAMDGEVIEATTDTYFGKYLKIKKDDIVIIYAHCSKLLVNVGDKVKKGELIAYVGNTGNSTGPHVHIEIRYKDRLVDPTDILGIEKE